MLIALLALTWGSVSNGTPATTLPTGLVLIAVGTVAVVSFAHYSRSVAVFSILLWVQSALLLATHADPLQQRLALGLLVLVASLNFFFWEESRQLRQGVRERVRAEQLARSLNEMTKRLAEQADHDGLTRLLNRRAGMRCLQQLQRQVRDGAAAGWLMMLDLDHFKRINDECGHVVGDQVLREVAGRIRQLAAGADIDAVRLGGEEFMLLGRHGDPVRIARQLLQRIRETPLPADDQGRPVRATASIGHTRLRRDDGAAVDAMRRADAFLYEGKRQGRDRAIGADDPATTQAA